ncbi:ABC transporter permease [Actinomadura madurae]|uniref:ABC transporter permease n=1 Tax=Actinomadura madurae TaxID=1993 RepID=UPI0020D20530|nr:ABC transporter permease [Actinomadura madurae]MCP9983144.1 ABC transporter permease [Actinomadura madurae]
MWLIARRSFAEGWMRLAATMLAALFSIGLISGSLQFGLRAQEAVSGSDASEYSRADVLVQGGQADPDDPYATPDGRVALGEVAGRPGVAAAAGDAMVPATAYGSDRTPIVPPAGAGTTLRPWTSDGRLNPYRLESGRAPAADGEVAVTRHVARAGGLDVGDPVKVMLPKRTRDMRVVGIVTVQGRSAVASGDLLLAPPATVQRAAGLPADTWQAVWVKAAAACLPRRCAVPWPATSARTSPSGRRRASATPSRPACGTPAPRSAAPSACCRRSRCSSGCSSSPTRSARSSGSGPGGSRCSARSGRRPARSGG